MRTLPVAVLYNNPNKHQDRILAHAHIWCLYPVRQVFLLFVCSHTGFVYSQHMCLAKWMKRKDRGNLTHLELQ